MISVPKVLFRAVQQTVRDRKVVVGTGFVRDEMREMCYGVSQ